jgi:hypothetical protein
MNHPFTNLPFRNIAIPALAQTGRSLLAAIAAALLFLALPWAGAAGEAALSGTFSVGGKATALKDSAAVKGEPESGKPVTVLVFTAKDPGKSAKPASDALFGEFGDAIVVKVFADGKVSSAELLHAAFDLPNNTLTLLGDREVSIKDFKNAEGAISGTLTSGGAKDARGQKWEVNLTFKAKAPWAQPDTR